MDTNEEMELLEDNPRKLRFDWLIPAIIHPKRTMKEISEQHKGVWLAPILLLSVMMILVVLASGPASKAALQNASAELPEDFQYYSPEQQEQFLAARAGKMNPAFIYVLPALGKIAVVWISWFLLGGILYLVLMMMGSHITSIAAFNLAAWSSFPLVLRSIVQIIAILVTGQLIRAPGLSGFAPEGASGIVALFWAMMRSFDLYLIWQVILLGLGIIPLSKMSRGKAWAAVILAVAMFIVLISLPTFIGAQLSSSMKGGL